MTMTRTATMTTPVPHQRVVLEGGARLSQAKPARDPDPRISAYPVPVPVLPLGWVAPPR